VAALIAKFTVWRNNFPTVRAGEFQCISAPFTKLCSFSVLKLAFWALHGCTSGRTNEVKWLGKPKCSSVVPPIERKAFHQCISGHGFKDFAINDHQYGG
jgi:hypothetical protein